MKRSIVAGVMASLMLMPDVTTAVCMVKSFSSVSVVEETYGSQWKGKKVAFLGDSITDKIRVGTAKCYWEYLEEMLGIKSYSYGINGYQMNGLLKQAELLLKERGQDIDAIIIFAGTNDYNHAIPLGEWYEEVKKYAPAPNNTKELRSYRNKVMTSETFRGRINMLLDYLKKNFPTKQIIMLTPLHRGFAQFSTTNIQPEETFSNKNGQYIDAYVNVVKEAANVWAVPVIDLNSVSGLYPVSDAHARYFHDEATDRLHPNADGHRRMALTLKYQLMALPCSFE